MLARHGFEADTSYIRRASPVEFFLLTRQIEREARTARAAAIGTAAVRAFAAAGRGLRLLSSVVRDAFALRDSMMPARERCRTCHPNHTQ